MPPPEVNNPSNKKDSRAALMNKQQHQRLAPPVVAIGSIKMKHLSLIYYFLILFNLEHFVFFFSPSFNFTTIKVVSVSIHYFSIRLTANEIAHKLLPQFLRNKTRMLTDNSNVSSVPKNGLL